MNYVYPENIKISCIPVNADMELKNNKIVIVNTDDINIQREVMFLTTKMPFVPKRSKSYYGDGRTVTICNIYKIANNRIYIGVAILNPMDTYDISIGQRIAMRRAFDCMINEETAKWYCNSDRISSDIYNMVNDVAKIAWGLFRKSLFRGALLLADNPQILNKEILNNILSTERKDYSTRKDYFK